jgi:hypothetical protein
MYLEAVEGIKKHLVKRTATEHLLYIAEQINDRPSPKMDHLVCFLPGVLALGVHHGLPSDHMEIAEVRSARSPPRWNNIITLVLRPLSLPPLIFTGAHVNLLPNVRTAAHQAGARDCPL